MFLYSQKKCIKYKPDEKKFELEKYQKADECSLFNWGSDGNEAEFTQKTIFFLQPNQRIRIVENGDKGLHLLEYVDSVTFKKHNNRTHIQLFDTVLKIGKFSKACLKPSAKNDFFAIYEKKFAKQKLVELKDIH